MEVYYRASRLLQWQNPKIRNRCDREPMLCLSASEMTRKSVTDRPTTYENGPLGLLDSTLDLNNLTLFALEFSINQGVLCQGQTVTRWCECCLIKFMWYIQIFYFLFVEYVGQAIAVNHIKILGDKMNLTVRLG